MEAQQSHTYIADKTKVINKILDMGRENFLGGLSRKIYCHRRYDNHCNIEKYS